MKKYSIFFLGVLLLLSNFLIAQIPPAPNPPRLVNDFAGILSPGEVQQLERKLVDFNDSTSNVICVVTVNDLGNYSAWEFARDIGEQWGVESKGYKNGVVILIKPRNETAGEVYIAVGYSLESVIPDATAKRIVDREMIPALKNKDYYKAINNALDVILPLASGEVSIEREENVPVLAIVFGFLFLIGFVVLIIYIIKKGGGQGGGNKHHSARRTIWFGPVGGGGSRGGSFSSGGFGGFGGSGGFGGGGAGGKF